LDLGASQNSFNPFWEQPKIRQNPFILNGMVVEYLQDDGAYKRLWGYLPGERLDTLQYWHLKKLGRPDDSIAPASTWKTLSSCESMPDDTDSLPPDVIGAEVVSIPPTVCASCLPVTYDGKDAQKLQWSSGGGNALSYRLTNTQMMKSAKSVAFDLRMPGCSSNGWEYSEIVPENPIVGWYGGLRLRQSVFSGNSSPFSIPSAQAWSTITFPWDGSSLTVGATTPTVINIVLNTGCPESYISNLRFLP
jgi:hypothetical protein